MNAQSPLKGDERSVHGGAMQIHVMQEGQQFGPFSKPQIESYLWEGNVQRSDLAWVEGMEDWLPLWQVLGLDPLPGEVDVEEEVVEEAVATEEAVVQEAVATEEAVVEVAAPVESGPVVEHGVESVSAPEEVPAEEALQNATEAVVEESVEVTPEEAAAPLPVAREIETKEGGPRLVIPATVSKALSRPTPISTPAVAPSPGVPAGATGGLAALHKPAFPRKATHHWRWLSLPTVILAVLCLFLPFFTVTCQQTKLPGASAKEMLFEDPEAPGMPLAGPEGAGLPEGESDASVDELPLSVPLVRACLWAVLVAAGLTSLFGALGAVSPETRFAGFGWVSAAVGIVALLVLGHHLGIVAERNLLASMTEGVEGAGGEAATLGVQMLGLELRMDAGYYGMLAALLLGAGSCCVPAYRSLTEGGSWMTMAVVLWVAAVAAAGFAFLQWSQKPVSEQTLEQQLEDQIGGALQEAFEEGGVLTVPDEGISLDLVPPAEDESSPQP